jgi:MFS family permease
MNYQKNIYLFIFSGFFGLVAYAMMIPVNIIRLHDLGYSSGMIGLFSSIPPLMILAVSPFLAYFQKLFGRKNLLFATKFLIAIVPMGFVLSDDFIFWCFMHFLIGIFAAILWPFTDSYIAEYTDISIKGRMTGLYQTLVGAAYAIGPVIPSFFKLSHGISIYIIITLELIAVIPIWFIRFQTSEDKHDQQEKLSYKHIITSATPLVILALLGGMYEIGTFSMGTLQAINIGIASVAAGYIPAANGFGSFLFQYPLGLIADRFHVDRIINASLILLLLSSLALFITKTFYPLIFLSAVWGALGGGIYTLIMVKISKQFKGTQVRTLTGVMISFYTLGYLIAPAISGVMMDHSPEKGLPIFLTAICGICMLGIFIMKDKKIS